MSNEVKPYELFNICSEAFESGSSSFFDDIQRWLENNKDNKVLLMEAANYQHETVRTTPLHYLVRAEPPTELVKRLLDLAPDTVKVPDYFGWLPLNWALIYKASPDVINRLFQAYPEAAEVQTYRGELPLNFALCNNASNDVINMLFNAYPKATEVQDSSGWLSLHTALCFRASSDVTTMLFKAYPKAIEVKNKEGCLPFHIALYRSASHDVIQLLFQAYPQAAEVQDDEGFLPLHYALENNASDDVINMLFQAYPKAAKVLDNDGELPLHIALCNNTSIDVIKMLLKAYPQAAGVADKYGCLPLHHACRSPINSHEGFFNRLNFLVSAYPEGINEKDIDGKFPSCYLKVGVLESNYTEPLYLLHDAVKSRLSTHLIKLLVQAFPESCTTKDNDGMVPLHYACTGRSSNFLEHVIVLLDAHKDSLQIKDSHGRTPLELLSNTASIPDEKGMLSLHHLTASSHTLTEQSLLLLVNAYPGSIGTADMYGMLPFHHACLNQVLSIEVLMILLSFYPEAVRCF